jgi:hypothetical protein
MLGKDSIPSSEADESDIEMPYPQFMPGKRKKVSNALLSGRNLSRFAQKQAEDWADKVVHSAIPTPIGEAMPTVASMPWLRGDSMTNSASIPWAIPGTAAAVAGGAIGGHHLVKWLLRKRRQSNLDAEVSQAKKEYEDAMLGQYSASNLHHVPKRASDLYDECKAAGAFNELLGGGLGVYLAGAGLLGTATGVGTYKYLKSRSMRKLLEDAVKRRARERADTRPADVFIHPTPTKITGDQLTAADRVDADPLKLPPV